jgi:hypothetical protein
MGDAAIALQNLLDSRAVVNSSIKRAAFFCFVARTFQSLEPKQKRGCSCPTTELRRTIQQDSRFHRPSTLTSPKGMCD